MKKSKLNFIITLFFIISIIFNTNCFANDTMLISENNTENSITNNIIDSDLYISQNGEYNINNSVVGNVYIETDTLNINSSSSGNIISGNLYAMANTVNIKSNFKFSETEKDELGNAKLEPVNNVAKIDGNVFVLANKFVLDPKCEITGDLYICANEINLSQSAVIRGNVYAFGDTLNLNCEITNGDLYANVKNFNLKYYGFIYRDLNLTATNANLEGYVYRNSFIEAKNITTTSSFENNKDFNVADSSNLVFSGQIKGTANINSRNITFKSKDNTEKNITCLISGDLNYSSKNEIQIEDKIISGNINYSQYKSSKSFFTNIEDYLLGLITSLVYVVIIYFALNKFAPKFVEKLSNINASSILKYLGLGILILVALPVLSILLLITTIGSLLSILITIIYALLLITAKPLVIIVISKLINKKFASINTFEAIVSTTIVLSLISLIPYVGFIVPLLVLIMGLGLIAKILFPSKK